MCLPVCQSTKTIREYRLAKIGPKGWWPFKEGCSYRDDGSPGIVTVLELAIIKGIDHPRDGECRKESASPRNGKYPRDGGG